ncbi:unnamed protein product [Nippostrongylus brasiliensis]|uniref:Secreted protein n=1 Tax=Nippostrongylus brasiliensis TaxID=27835 RepID=A0A0N4YU57_NIPBR|nr:unnamed protein product [Nippostrongylus brasiliensis]
MFSSLLFFFFAIAISSTIEGESAGNGNAEYLRRELEEICSSTLNEGNRNSRYDTQGCPRPSNRHYDVYATTFGTRRRRSDSCFTVMNVYENVRRARPFGPLTI